MHGQECNFDFERDLCYLSKNIDVQSARILRGFEIIKMDIYAKTLVVLPHLDDEFAVAPAIRAITKIRSSAITVIFCAERITTSVDRKNQRRTESLRSMNFLGCCEKHIVYLNDIFPINDLEISEAAGEIYDFLANFLEDARFEQIITLSLEGGHPDHDALALVVRKAGRTKNIPTIFVPTYNHEGGALAPIGVLTPLKSQIKSCYYLSLAPLCWLDSLMVAFIYKSERFAFFKLLPFIVARIVSSRRISFLNSIDVSLVDWQRSLVSKRYKVDHVKFLKKMEEYG